MTTTEQYTIHDIVQMIKEDKLRLPTFQRNYVWEKSDIEKLFSTLLSDNTFGAISAIKTTTSYPIFSTRSFIDDLRDKYQLSEANYTPNYSPDDPLYLILDGQQRLQSFYLAFEGTFDNNELFFNTEDCTVGFYENCPNDNWIPIKKLYNKMCRSSYEQTAKFFGKEGNKSIFKFFYHIFFTKSITFLISEPINELEKDRERFTNLFIKVNASGKGLDKWETFRCIITGMRPETVKLFSDLASLEQKIKGNLPSRLKFDTISTIFDCLLNVTHDEYRILLKKISEEEKINYIAKTIDPHFAKMFPIFINNIQRLRFIMLIDSFDSDIIISLYREFNRNIDSFNIQICYVKYTFQLLRRHFTQDDDCWLFIYSRLSHIISDNVKNPKSHFLGTSSFYGEKHDKSNYKLYSSTQSASKNNDTLFFYSIGSLQICFDGRETKLIDDNTTFFFDINDEDRKTAIEEYRKTFSEQWQIRDNEWNKIIND